MSRYWGYSKRPKNWKKLLKEDPDDTEDPEDLDKAPTTSKPTTSKPTTSKPTTSKPALQGNDSSFSY